MNLDSFKNIMNKMCSKITYSEYVCKKKDLA